MERQVAIGEIVGWRVHNIGTCWIWDETVWHHLIAEWSTLKNHQPCWFFFFTTQNFISLCNCFLLTNRCPRMEDVYSVLSVYLLPHTVGALVGPINCECEEILTRNRCFFPPSMVDGVVPHPNPWQHMKSILCLVWARTKLINYVWIWASVWTCHIVQKFKLSLALLDLFVKLSSRFNTKTLSSPFSLNVQSRLQIN